MLKDLVEPDWEAGWWNQKLRDQGSRVMSGIKGSSQFTSL